jgi:hypothetical protein
MPQANARAHLKSVGVARVLRLKLSAIIVA